VIRRVSKIHVDVCVIEKVKTDDFVISDADSISTRFHITKYPTLKVIRNGQPAKREYRGQRSVDAFVEYVKKQLADPIKEFTALKDINEIDVSAEYFELFGVTRATFMNFSFVMYRRKKREL
jgi:hypothetical protein